MDDAGMPSDPADRAGQMMGRTSHMMRSTSLDRRWDPTNEYAPAIVDCPSMPKGNNYHGFLRNTSDFAINSQEQAWLKKRHQHTKGAWADWLKQVGMDDVLEGGVDKYLSDDKKLPKAGLAISGGGYRAMLYGISIMNGLDSRNETAKKRGTGGLFQALDYVAGLSGGSWATGSMAMNEFPTAQEMLKYLNLEQNLILPDKAPIFYGDIIGDVMKKKHAGFPVSMTDLWGRALSYHLLDSQNFYKQGQRAVFSDITNKTHFQDATGPFPIVIAIGRKPEEQAIHLNATFFEFTPYEFGTWNPLVSAFMPIGSLGSTLKDGKPSRNDKKCVSGFDNFGWVVGSSSTLFNAALFKLKDTKKSIGTIIEKGFLSKIDKDNNDVSVLPNPLQGFAGSGKNPFKDPQYLDLVDGGEAKMNIPMEPLLQPARDLDMVIAADGGSEESSWPNGKSLVTNFERSKLDLFSYMAMPDIPDLNTFVAEGLNTRPVFFGCSTDKVQNKDKAKDKVPPLIVYLPNYPYSNFSNTSTYRLAYSMEDQQMMMSNGLDVATMGGKMDDWPRCLACASLMRGMMKSKTKVPDQCNQCFQKYCWNGKASKDKAANYTPPVGPPPFVASNGKDMSEPPSTGSNASSAGFGDVVKGADDASAPSLDGRFPIVLAITLSAVVALFL